MEHCHLFIGNSWVRTHKTVAAVDPSTGEAFGEVHIAGSEQVESAVAAASSALPDWRETPISARAALITQVANLLAREYGEQGTSTPLKELIGKETGKRLPEADIEVIESSDMLRHFASIASSILAPRQLTLDTALWPTKRSSVIFEPVGVVAAIKPWNYPLELPVWTIGPALLSGNTVVLKSSQHAAFVGAALARLFLEAGAPPGILNVISGDDDTGRDLVGNDGVNMIAFTGSVAAGREIAGRCGEMLKRTCLELGGNDPAIVVADADLELTANGLVWGAFANSGQVCVRPKRVYAAAELLPRLVPMLVDRTRALRPRIDYGPLISSQQRDIVTDLVDDATRRGARVLTGGAPEKSMPGFFFPPTILSDVPPDARLLSEECFGPVMPLLTVKDIREAVASANDSSFGLGASVWTSDVTQGRRIANSLLCGMVWINDVNVAFPQAPWGGVKASGIGSELGEWGFYEYVTKKHVSHDESAEVRRAWWYPY